MNEHQELYAKDTKIRAKVLDLYKDLELAKKVYEDLRDTILQQIKETQDVCSHRVKRYSMGTPYDSSFHTCEIYGKQDV